MPHLPLRDGAHLHYEPHGDGPPLLLVPGLGGDSRFWASHVPELARHFTGTNQKWFNYTNGAHIDSIDPYTYNRWYDFLELFVAHQAPIVNVAKRAMTNASPRSPAVTTPSGETLAELSLLLRKTAREVTSRSLPSE